MEWPSAGGKLPILIMNKSIQWWSSLGGHAARSRVERFVVLPRLLRKVAARGREVHPPPHWTDAGRGRRAAFRNFTRCTFTAVRVQEQSRRVMNVL